MSRAVLISIQPKWTALILKGIKTIEVRKTRPSIDTPFKCYIYCTKAQNPVLVALQNLEDSPVIMTCGTGTRRYPVEDASWARLLNGTVCGEFTCDHIERYVRVGTTGSPHTYYRKVEPGTYLAKDIDYKAMCLTPDEFAEYGNGKILYGWHISGLNVYDKPRELSEFTKPCPNGHDCGMCSWYFPGIQDYGRCEPPCCGFWESDDSMIARPPQSWCFVEED